MTRSSETCVKSKTCTTSEFILVLLYIFLAVVLGICYQNIKKVTI